MTQKEIVSFLIKNYGIPFPKRAGFSLKDRPSSLFQMLVFSILLSTRISHNIAIDTMKAIRKQGWTTPKKMRKTAWKQRVNVINKAGYARYDESTSRMLEDNLELLKTKYNDDLRNLRKQAEKDPKKERSLLKEFKGIGDTGADIFFRDVQSIWPELKPFTDKKTESAASKLGLPKDAEKLRKLSGEKFQNLLSALVFVDLENKYGEMPNA